MDHFKKATAGASVFLSRAKQFTEEKLGGAERTEYDANFEALLRKADVTRGWTERIVTNAEAVLQPNPNDRIEDFLMTKFDKKVTKPNNADVLGHCLAESGIELGTNTQYGSALVKVGEAEKKLGFAEHEFVQKVSESFVQPLKSFLDGQMRIIQKEKKTLEAKRLDLDACKAKLKKQRDNRARAEELVKTEDELRKCQTEFDRQLELTKLLLDELHVTHSHHLRCLSDFVDAQLNFHMSATKVLQDLHKQIGGLTMNYNFNSNINSNSVIPKNSNSNVNSSVNSNSSSTTSKPNNQLLDLNISYSTINNPTTTSNNDINSNLNTIKNSKQKAKVLFDYEAGDHKELSVLANEIVSVQISANDNDWVYAEKGNEQGKIPKAYIQIE